MKRMNGPVTSKPSVKPKRPTGQFQGLRETEGKINGGGYGEAQHPQTHADFERLGSK